VPRRSRSRGVLERPFLGQQPAAERTWWTRGVRPAPGGNSGSGRAAAGTQAPTAAEDAPERRFLPGSGGLHPASSLKPASRPTAFPIVPVGLVSSLRGLGFCEAVVGACDRPLTTIRSGFAERAFDESSRRRPIAAISGLEHHVSLSGRAEAYCASCLVSWPRSTSQAGWLQQLLRGQPRRRAWPEGGARGLGGELNFRRLIRASPACQRRGPGIAA